MNSINNTESASQIGYNNTTSGLTATDVQGAVDKLADKITRNKYVNSTMSPQASVAANTDYMTHKLVIPEAGTYLVMGEILGIGGNIILSIILGESTSGTVVAGAWSSQNKCIFAVTSRNANDVLTLWIRPDSSQDFYADSRGQRFFAIKLL